MTISAIGGKHYFLTFINDHSNKVWVYFLKHKSEVFEASKMWKAMVENETNLKIKKLRTDNSSEYEVTKVKTFCYEHGIMIEKIMPSTPQHKFYESYVDGKSQKHAYAIRSIKAALDRGS